MAHRNLHCCSGDAAGFVCLQRRLIGAKSGVLVGAGQDPPGRLRHPHRHAPIRSVAGGVRVSPAGRAKTRPYHAVERVAMWADDRGLSIVPGERFRPLVLPSVSPCGRVQLGAQLSCVLVVSPRPSIEVALCTSPLASLSRAV